MKAFKKNTNPGGRNNNEMSQQLYWHDTLAPLPDEETEAQRCRWPRSPSWEGDHLRGWEWVRDLLSVQWLPGAFGGDVTGSIMKASASPWLHLPSFPKQHGPHVGGCGQAAVGIPQGLAPGPLGGPRKCAQPLESMWHGRGAGSRAWPAGYCCPGLLSLLPSAFASGNLGSCAGGSLPLPPVHTHRLSLLHILLYILLGYSRSCRMCDPSPSPLPSQPRGWA